jgi:signal transduction histidine kinase
MSRGHRLVPHGFAADVFVAVCFLALGEAELWGGWRAGGDGPPFHGSRPPEALLIALVTLPLAWRRRRPLLAAAVVSLTLALHALFVAPDVSFLAGLLPLAVMVYSVACWGPPRWRLLGLACLVAAQVALASQIAEMRSTGEVLFGTFVTAGTWFVGDLARGHRRRASHSTARARRLEAERAEWTSAAIAEERARIARELHDVIAHSVSLMGVQAGAARTQLDADPGRAREALRAVETTARESVLELCRLLGVLREDDPQPGLEPQPGIEQIDSLIAQVRAAGLPVNVSVEGWARVLPAGVALSAYRIVQEALTNALKHAGDARAEVRIRYSDEALELEVSDDGQGAGVRNGGRGHGLIGMRERAALYGGTLEAGPRAEHGFAVRARLPLEPHGR